MSPKGHLIFIISLVLILAGCVGPSTKLIQVDSALAEIEARKQREIALTALLANHKRLNAVGYRLLKNSLAFCPDKQTSSLGFHLANRYSFGKDFEETAFSVLNLGEAVSVLQVYENSPVDRAGIREGDIVTAINNEKISKGKKGSEHLFKKIREAVATDVPVHFEILRNDMLIPIPVAPEKICDYQVFLKENDFVNAFADGKMIVITSGMMRFAKNDTELSLVVAHELAHNVMGHIRSKMINAIPGLLLDLLAAGVGVNTQGLFMNMTANAYSQEFEAEADYVGLYMMKKSGMEIENAPDFWRRMAAIHPGSIKTNLLASHPATPERFLALEKTVEEIRDKVEKGLPLAPEMEEKSWWETDANQETGEEEKENDTNE